MTKLLVLAYYYYFDGKCVEPPADYGFLKPQDRQSVLDRIKEEMPRRDLIGKMLAEQGITLVNLDNVLSYDERGLGCAGIGYAVAVGLSDSEDLRHACMVGSRDFDQFAAAASLAAEMKVSVSAVNALLG